MDVRVGYKESWALKNWCFWTMVLEKTLERPLDCKEIQPVHSEGGQPCDFFGRNDAKAETPALWPPHAKSWLIGKDWCWEGLGAGGEGDDRGWDGWMASLTRWTWVSVNSGRWWWTGRPGVLRFMGSQKVRHDWETDMIWSDHIKYISHHFFLLVQILYFSGIYKIMQVNFLVITSHKWNNKLNSYMTIMYYLKCKCRHKWCILLLLTIS